VDTEAVHAFLSDHVGEIERLEAVGHGEWSRAFYFTCRQRELVVRFSAIDDDFLKDQRVQRKNRNLPIPRLLEIGEAFNGFFAISERAHGTFLEERDAAAMQRLLPSLLDTLDGIRHITVDDSRGSGLWRGSDGHAPYATWRESLLSIATRPPSPRLPGWREALARSPSAQRAFDAGYAAMQPLVDACPNERFLLHSDLLYFNVLVERDVVSAVFDWGSSMYGDFLWDLAWITFWQPWYAAWSEVDVRQAGRAHYASIGLDVPNFDARLRCYELAIGLDGVAYQAVAGKPGELDWTAAHLQRLAAATR